MPLVHCGGPGKMSNIVQEKVLKLIRSWVAITSAADEP